jgi:hypothetical protein
MYIVAPEPISAAYIINPSHWSVCLYINPTIVARQRLDKNVTAVTNTHARIEVLFDSSFAVRVVPKQCTRLFLPRTSCSVI